jgi:hypothetical protein
MRRAALAALASIFVAASAHAQDSSPEDLTRRMIEHRAVEAVIWGMPAVNYELMYQAMVREIKGDFNQIVYWSRLSDWKNRQSGRRAEVPVSEIHRDNSALYAG